MLKGLTERSWRENAKNIPATNAVTPITQMAVTRNDDDGKRIPKKFKTGINFDLNDGLVYYFGDGKRRLCLFSSIKKHFSFNLYRKYTRRNTSLFQSVDKKNLHSPFFQKINRR